MSKDEISLFLINKANLKQKDFNKIEKFIASDEEKEDYDKFEFFVLLKLVSLYQINGNKVSFEDIHEVKPLPLPELHIMSLGPDKVEIPEGDKEEFIKIDVDKPHEVGSFFNKHTVYTIKTKTKYPHFNGDSFKVDRRYNDFDWLHMRLSQRFPQVMIPPLPEKQYSGRFQKDFVETRRLGLQTFLVKIKIIIERSWR